MSRRIRFHRHAFLKDVRRSHGGAQYRRLEETIARLKNTTVVTTIRAKGRKTVMFSWIEYAEIERTPDGQMAEAVVVLPEWLFDAACTNGLVLSLHRDYYLLTGGLERWLYRFVRKSAGRSASGWTWRMRTLHERSGSTQRYKYFAREIRELARGGGLLDYEIRCDERDGEAVLVARRRDGQGQVGSKPASRPLLLSAPSLRTVTYERAKALVPGLDIYALEQEWREASSKNAMLIRDPDRAFLAWCRVVGNRKVAGGVISAARVAGTCGQRR